MINVVKSGLYGLAIGDAIGVPGEFMSRDQLKATPITDMQGGGVHDMPAGTWSDDTSMTLCLADSLAIHGTFQPQDVMERFSEWMIHGEYTSDGTMFDVGNACRQAIFRFANGTPAEQCGGLTENSNGNGSLMRILPIAYYLHAKGKNSIFDHTEDAALVATVSALTHAHPRSIIACGLYVEMVLRLLQGDAPKSAVKRAMEKGFGYYKAQGEPWKQEISNYSRLGDVDSFAALPEEEIRSTGYVVDTMEASTWCFLNTHNYRDCILLAVSLGRDTDTTAAVAGGLAGLYYGIEAIPQNWKDGLLNCKLLEDIVERLYLRLYKA